MALILDHLPTPRSSAYREIKSRAGKATALILALTKTEMWSVPQENVGDVKAASARRGVGVTELDAHWSQVLRLAPADAAMTDRQRSMLERMRAAQATTGVGIVAAPAAPTVEYALTRGADAAGAAGDTAKITIALNATTALTLTRTSVDVRSDSCVWRGTVDGTGAPAVLMWWPGGKIAGTVAHEGRLFSIQHIGGDMHVVVETREDRMPRDHAPPRPQRMRDAPGSGDSTRPIPATHRP